MKIAIYCYWSFFGNFSLEMTWIANSNCSRLVNVLMRHHNFRPHFLWAPIFFAIWAKFMDYVQTNHIQAYDFLSNFDEDPCTKFTTSQIDIYYSTIHVHEITVYTLLQITNIVSWLVCETFSLINDTILLKISNKKYHRGANFFDSFNYTWTIIHTKSVTKHSKLQTMYIVSYNYMELWLNCSLARYS